MNTLHTKKHSKLLIILLFFCLISCGKSNQNNSDQMKNTTFTEAKFFSIFKGVRPDLQSLSYSVRIE